MTQYRVRYNPDFCSHRAGIVFHRSGSGRLRQHQHRDVLMKHETRNNVSELPTKEQVIETVIDIFVREIGFIEGIAGFVLRHLPKKLEMCHQYHVLIRRSNEPR